MEKPTILIIDDELFARRILEHAIQRLGYQSDVAMGAVEGYQRMLGKKYDAVTCDLMMPGESGLDFLKLIKANPYLREIPVVMISAAGQDEALEEAQTLGAAGFVSKPFSEAQLKRALASVLQ